MLVWRATTALPEGADPADDVGSEVLAVRIVDDELDLDNLILVSGDVAGDDDDPTFSPDGTQDRLHPLAPRRPDPPRSWSPTSSRALDRLRRRPRRPPQAQRRRPPLLLRPRLVPPLRLGSRSRMSLTLMVVRGGPTAYGQGLSRSMFRSPSVGSPCGRGLVHGLGPISRAVGRGSSTDSGGGTGRRRALSMRSPRLRRAMSPRPARILESVSRALPRDVLSCRPVLVVLTLVLADQPASVQRSGTPIRRRGRTPRVAQRRVQASTPRSHHACSWGTNSRLEPGHRRERRHARPRVAWATYMRTVTEISPRPRPCRSPPPPHGRCAAAHLAEQRPLHSGHSEPVDHTPYLSG